MRPARRFLWRRWENLAAPLEVSSQTKLSAVLSASRPKNFLKNFGWIWFLYLHHHSALLTNMYAKDGSRVNSCHAWPHFGNFIDTSIQIPLSNFRRLNPMLKVSPNMSLKVVNNREVQDNTAKRILKISKAIVLTKIASLEPFLID